MGCVGVDNERLYKLLEVEKTASRSEIRKAHQKMVRLHHPDRGGDPEKFKEVQSAYETLNDPEKRAKYDEFGEEDIDKSMRPADFFDVFRDAKRRPRTKDVVTPLKITLEQLYSGITKKMAVNRQVIDKAQGVSICQACSGRGAYMKTLESGMLRQQMQAICDSCNGAGKTYQRMKQREILEVHVQKGSVNGQKIVFREKADEQPDADTGDVIFVVSEKEHPEFKRRGADLFIERKISLAEALCGFQLEVTHLDGRKLIIKSSPGEIVKPLPFGFDPMMQSDEPEWECFEGFDCPDIDSVVRAEETTEELLKKACQTQLKNRGLEVSTFVVDGQGAHFKQCSRAEALAAQKPSPGSKMYVLADPLAPKRHRMMKAVQGEGMPTLKNPFVFGNLFLVLSIEFPESLPQTSLDALRQVLPPLLNTTTICEEDDGIEVCTVSDIDPVTSRAANAANLCGQAYDTDDEERGPGMQQCHQM